MEEQLSTRQVAQSLRVSESSVKRWCDRGAIPTVRTVGGHRRIPLSGFLKFLDATNRRVYEPLASQTASEPIEPETLAAMQARFVRAIAQGDETACRDLLATSYASTKSFARLADQFVADTFHQLGEQWECGELQVYQERRGCEVCAKVLFELRRLLPEVSATAPLALGGAPEGDHYSLPSRLVELVLSECGWRSMNLGANLPLKTIAAAAIDHRPTLVWLSISHLSSDGFTEDYRSFYQSLPPNTTVVLGGRALTDELRPSLDYTGFCDNMQQLALFARALYGNSTTPSGK